MEWTVCACVRVCVCVCKREGFSYWEFIFGFERACVFYVRVCVRERTVAVCACVFLRVIFNRASQAGARVSLSTGSWVMISKKGINKRRLAQQRDAFGYVCACAWITWSDKHTPHHTYKHVGWGGRLGCPLLGSFDPQLLLSTRHSVRGQETEPLKLLPLGRPAPCTLAHYQRRECTTYTCHYNDRKCDCTADVLLHWSFSTLTLCSDVW